MRFTWAASTLAETVHQMHLKKVIDGLVHRPSPPPPPFQRGAFSRLPVLFQHTCRASDSLGFCRLLHGDRKALICYEAKIKLQAFTCLFEVAAEAHLCHLRTFHTLGSATVSGLPWGQISGFLALKMNELTWGN
jgi:hypothetical protein